MAYQSKDGRKFGSAYVAKRKDEESAKSAAPEAREPKAPAPSPKAGVDASRRTQEAPQKSDLNQDMHAEGSPEAKQGESHPVVAQHGPAHKIVISHDHAAKKHSVQSHHGDGHINNTEHADPGQAHDEARSLADVKDKFPEEAQQGAMSEEDGFEMPPLV